jgi:hypothetical protein
MASAPTSPASVDDIRRDMAQIRQKLHQDMKGVVAGAEAASDWKHYVGMYPLAALGATFLAGFLVVPRKRRSATKTAEKAAEAVVAKLSETSPLFNNATQTREPVAPRRGIVGTVFSMVMPVVIRTAQNYALNHLETLISKHQTTTGPAQNPRPSQTEPTSSNSPKTRTFP